VVPCAMAARGAAIFVALTILGWTQAGALGSRDDPGSAVPERSWERERRAMVDHQIRARGVLSPEVLAAMARVPRHLFVPPAERSASYEDRPLPIGCGQTISQPFIVAFMTELLELEPADRVLEIGTGSGYQAAVLAELAREVFSIEIVAELGRNARAALDQGGYGEVRLRVSDGYDGWEEEAPFDAIVVTAAVDHVPPPLVAQLKPGGRMVIPIGAPWDVQALVLLTKDAAGRVESRRMLAVRFVPFTRSGSR
jgi:protein-L-isoaspartate(D-aspartate) O-methyltransferase